MKQWVFPVCRGIRKREKRGRDNVEKSLDSIQLELDDVKDSVVWVEKAAAGCLEEVRELARFVWQSSQHGFWLNFYEIPGILRLVVYSWRTSEISLWHIQHNVAVCKHSCNIGDIMQW